MNYKPIHYHRSAWITPGQAIDLITVEGEGRKNVIEILAATTYSSDASSWGNIQFELICDGMPHREYGTFSDQLGNGSQLLYFPEQFITANSKITLRITNTHPTDTFQVGAILQGRLIDYE